MPDLSVLLASELARNILATVILMLGLGLARSAALRVIRRTALPSSEVRRWIVQIRNATVLVFIFAIVIVWASELRAVALSFVAIAAAIVLATKELISCLTGGMLRTGARAFGIGDRIEIGVYRGDVVDQSLLTTTILEIGPGQQSHQYTGRAITLPNSLFLTLPVINESFTDEYVLHTFVFKMKRAEPWRAAEKALLAAANAECASYLASARTHMERLSSARGLEAPSVEPRVSLTFPTADEVDLLVRIPCPARRKGRIEQAIMRRFLEAWGSPPAT